MKLVQLQYWVTIYPAMLASGDTQTLPRGGHLLGTWSLTVEDLDKSEIITALRDLYVRPLQSIRKQGGVLNVYQATELDSLKQVRHLLSLGKRTDMPDLTVMQHIEQLEGGNLCLVHNLQARHVADLD